MEADDATILPECTIRLICVVCGRASEVLGDVDTALKNQIRRETGFSARIVQVDARGTCRACSQRVN